MEYNDDNAAMLLQWTYGTNNKYLLKNRQTLYFKL